MICCWSEIQIHPGILYVYVLNLATLLWKYKLESWDTALVNSTDGKELLIQEKPIPYYIIQGWRVYWYLVSQGLHSWFLSKENKGTEKQSWVSFAFLPNSENHLHKPLFDF